MIQEMVQYVSWVVDKNLSIKKLTDAIDLGINLANVQKAEDFEKKYGHSFNLIFDNTSEIALGIPVTGEINVSKASSTTMAFT